MITPHIRINEKMALAHVKKHRHSDDVWIGWSRLNLLRITKTAVMGSNNRTAQAILATALQQTTLRINQQLCSVENMLLE